MRKSIFGLIFTLHLILIIACETGINGNPNIDGSIENANVYLLGENSYWKNDIQYTLSIPDSYDNVNAEKIIVSNGKVFVLGSFRIDAGNGGFYTQACYWQNGIFSAFSTDSNIIVNLDDVFVSNGNIYASSFKGYWWINKTQNKIPSEKSSVYDLFVYNNAVYMAGYNYDNSWTACYWLNNNKFVLPSPNNYYSTEANGIFVDGGNVYCCGDYLGKIFYWINGQLFNIETPSVNRYETNDIIISSGKTFIFGSFSYATGGGITTSCYWEDGILKLLPTGTNMAVTPLVYNGKVYTFDNGFDSSPTHPIHPNGRANYFINGETYPIDSPNNFVQANSIFVFNNDVYITGSYHDGNTSRACYWINGTKRIELSLNTFVRGIYIEQK